MTIGIDVSKDWLVACTPKGRPLNIANSPQDIREFLEQLDAATTVAMEATGRYHRPLADAAFAMGFKVLVLNPKDVSHYTRSISPRTETDPVCARNIARFADKEDFRPYTPVPEQAQALMDLVRTRAGLVVQCVALQNRAREQSQIKIYLDEAIRNVRESIKKLDQEITQAAKAMPQYELLIKVPGFGPLTTSYLVAILAGRTFKDSDAFVAYLGLDVKIKDSGKHKGARRLTKRGDPEIRRLLWLAGVAASRHDGPFAQIRSSALAKGLPKTAAAVVVARKLARLAWAIYTNKEPYSPDRVLSQSHTTESSSPELCASLAPQETSGVSSSGGQGSNDRRLGLDARASKYYNPPKGQGCVRKTKQKDHRTY